MSITERKTITFETEPSQYKHWKLSIDGPVATLAMDVDAQGGLFGGYELKLNSYDLGVDIELHDAVQRLRFEHPEVGAVVLTSAKEKVFCAGANIKMLGLSTHAHKVNFCKFTNETRLELEDASQHSQQTWMCAVNGTAAGGGYELALATEYIMMLDDGNTAVSLPELPLLAVLPGTGGLTRVVDKRHVRRDLADVFSTTEEGVKGKRAVQWDLVDEVVPSSRFQEAVQKKALELSQPRGGKGIALTPLRHRYVEVKLDRKARTADILVQGPEMDPPATVDADFWLLALARELDDAILNLRFNEPTITSWVLHTKGDARRVLAYDRTLQQTDWLSREIALYWKRVLKRLETSSRSVFALIEPESCYVGFLFELALAADRSLMLDVDKGPTVCLTE
ncbi:MAG: enoyl-CoA hydratase-related protein, partial [Candidatus Xenobia bacterium]